MIWTFEYYNVTDTGIEMFFLNANTRVMIFVTDAELSGITTQNQLRTLVIAKLQRKLQANGIAAKLDPLIGNSVTI